MRKAHFKSTSGGLRVRTACLVVESNDLVECAPHERVSYELPAGIRLNGRNNKNKITRLEIVFL